MILFMIDKKKLFERTAFFVLKYQIQENYSFFLAKRFNELKLLLEQKLL